MTKRMMMLLALIAFGPGSAAWSDTPFDGTWRLNTAKSNLAGDTMSFADAGGGMLKYTDSAQSYTFKPDGGAFTTPFGIERTFRKTSDTTFITSNRKNGLLLNTSWWKLSLDGSTLVIESKGTKPNGEAFDNVTTYTRTSPGKGLLGGWESTSVKLSSPNALTFETQGADVTLTISAIKATAHAKWDGKDYPANGPTLADGITLALTRMGHNSFKLVQKFKDKPIAIIHYHVAADGKTMDAKGSDGQGKEPFTQTWEKQT